MKSSAKRAAKRTGKRKQPKSVTSPPNRELTNRITKVKLGWQDEKWQILISHFQRILDKYEKPENKDSLEFLGEIHSALSSYTESENPAAAETKDLTVFLNWINVRDQDEVIYFGSKQLVRHWIELLVQKIKYQVKKSEYGCSFGSAMTQYLDAHPETDETDEVVMELPASGTELTDKEKTIQQFSKWIFNAPSNFNEQKFENLLNTALFDMEDPTQKNALLETRNEIAKFCQTFHETACIEVDDVKRCINGLLSEDLLSCNKRKELENARQNRRLLLELTTILNHFIKNFNSWKWPEPVCVVFRRNMAGRYRAYMDEDIVTAIFLHYIGARWCIIFKKLFKKIYSSGMWIWGTGTIGDVYYNSIEGYRKEFHGKSFLSILPSEIKDVGSTGYDDENRNKDNTKETTPINIKQKLLHLISTEIQLNSVVRPDEPLAVVQTDMEWFGPSIVHDAIYSLMKFFHVSEQWMTFFRKFLECPLRVGSHTAPVQVRQRGVPISHLLSNLFGESLLFTLDLFVNQKSGLSLYRIHDDFWFWGHENITITNAWTSIKQFVSISGLKINEEKSASVVCKYDKSAERSDTIIHGPEPLPQRKVKWGFLYLHSDGFFRINEELLEPHVKEMRDCLLKSDIVMDWVNCHNRYIRFFIRNFANPALTFGKQHIGQILKVLKSIMKTVHKEANGYPVEALKLKFPGEWKDKDVMDSWVHWPKREGGLSLFNPFLDLIPLHEAYRRYEAERAAEGVTNIFGRAIDQDIVDWNEKLERSKHRAKAYLWNWNNTHDGTITDPDEPYSNWYSEKDEVDRKRARNRLGRVGKDDWFLRNRETKWERWRAAFCELLKELKPDKPQQQSGDSWRECLYSSQMEYKLGQRESFVDHNLIPLSLINSMETSRAHKN